MSCTFDLVFIYFLCFSSVFLFIYSYLYSRLAAGRKRSKNGYCYLVVFPSWAHVFVSIILGEYPEFDRLMKVSSYRVFHADWDNYCITSVDQGWHVIYAPHSVKMPDFTGKVGSTYFNKGVEYISNTNVRVPKTNYNRVGHNAVKMATDANAIIATKPTRSTRWRGLKGVSEEVRHTHIVNDATKRQGMSKASACASAKILLGSDSMLGETYAENLALSLEEFGSNYVTTHINPSSKMYRKLVEALRIPLQYVPKVAGHDAAGTCRRAYIQQMSELTKGSMVGMISPSLQEWHINPYGAGYYYKPDVGVDPARITRSCSRCGGGKCKVLENARKDGRVASGALNNAISLFKYLEVDYLWMVNIEPNIKATDVLHLMRCANIEQGYSISTIDWRVLEGRTAYCPLMEQETSAQLDKVVSKFAGAGTYIQPRANVAEMFAPTFGGGCALRRTIIGSVGISLFMELQVDHGGYGTNFVPDQSSHYLIPVPHPNEGLMYIKVEKHGFDRVMQVFRTTVTRTVETARIQLRQANVTYSVSGTALTPRLEVSATESELLAIWMCSYSAVMDVISDLGVGHISAFDKVAVKQGKLGTVVSSVYSVVSDRLFSNAAETNSQFGSQSAVRTWLRTCERDGRFMTLDEISSMAYQDVYGKSFVVSSSWNCLNKKWGSFITKMPSADSFVSAMQMVGRTTWSLGFTCADVFARSLIIAGAVSTESIGFLLDTAVHICRCIGIDPEPIRRTINYIDTMHRPAGKIWADVIDAQALPFQAASIKIVESLVNHFSPDPATLSLAMQERKLGERLPELGEEMRRRAQEKRDFDTSMDDIPFARFLIELKLFLAKMNTRVNRISQLNGILCAARERCGKMSEEQKENIARLLRTAPTILASLPPVVEGTTPSRSLFTLSNKVPQMIPLPLPPVYSVNEDGYEEQCSIQTAFNEMRTVNLDRNNVTRAEPHRMLKRLKLVNGRADFSPIVEKMEQNFPAFLQKTDAPLSLPQILPGSTCEYSPDDIGATFLDNIVKRCTQSCMDDLNLAREGFVDDEQVVAWIGLRADGSIPAVTRAINQSLVRLRNDRVPYIMHIEGLAMGGKSKGVRSWISKDDVVVVPSNNLKDEWIENLGELDPLARASVYTQHTALTQNCARYVIVDEAYTFETPHLELLRRYPNAKGFITIGDGHQIKDVFAEGTSSLNPTEMKPYFTAVAPVTFVPYDAAVTYLRTNTSPVRMETYYSGSPIWNGLHYCIEADEVITLGKGDICVNGTQNGKGYMIARGVSQAKTSHEAQGGRSEYTFVHSIEAFGVDPDLGFLGAPDNVAHFGVTITRARQGTCFVVKDRATARQIPYTVDNFINGTSPLPVDSMYGGTSYDLIDPVLLSDITYEKCSDSVVVVTDSQVSSYDSHITLASLVSKDNDEGFPLESIKHTDIDVSRASIVNTHSHEEFTSEKETFVFNPANVKTSSVMNMIERSTRPGQLTDKHFQSAGKIVKLLFDRVIDPHMFYKLLSYDKASISRQTRDQVIKMALSKQETRSDTVSFAFGKNEPSKKVMTIGGTLKTLSVTAMNQTQLMLFSDVSDSLTHAWSRSLRSGIIAPVGFTKPEVAKVLGSMHTTFEIDLEKQDSTHSLVHVAVFVMLIEIAAKRLGMHELVGEIRQARMIGDMTGIMRMIMGSGLGSGDAWTLIANMIMAWSVLVSRYVIPTVLKVLQVGDDITVDRKLRLRAVPLTGSEGVTEKKLHTTTDSGRPSFTSNVALSPDYSIAARVRGIIKMATQPRTRTQQISYKVETGALKENIAPLGLPAYAEAHHRLFQSEPAFVEWIISKAIEMANIEFDDLPEEFKLHAVDEKRCIMHSRSFGCFGFALSHCVSSNVAAINALAAYSRPVTTSEAIDICKAEKVELLLVDEMWSNKKSADKMAELYADRRKTSPLMICYKDHAVSFTSISSETISLGGLTKYRVNLMDESVEEIQL